MTKSELKSIIKECLLEILTDGLGESLNEVKKKKVNSQRIVEEKQRAARIEAQNRSMKNVVNNLTDDPILREVLAHTAKTTLVEQAAADVRPQNVRMDSPQTLDESVDNGLPSGDPGLDIGSIFGGASRNWAAAAFAPAKKLPGQ